MPRTPAESQAVPSHELGQEQEGAVEVKVSLQPPELFEKNDVPITETASTDAYSLVLAEVDGVGTYRLYDATGKLLAMPDNCPMYVTGNFLAQCLSNHYNKKWLGHLVDGVNYSDVVIKIDDVLKENNITDFSADHLRRWGQHIVKKYPPRADPDAYNYEELRAGKVWLELPAKLSSSFDGKWLVFQRGGTVNAYQTVDAGGNTLTPDKWQLHHFNLQKVTDKQLAEFPWLREYLVTDRGMPIEGTTVAISCERGILNAIDTKKNQRVFSDAAVGFVADPNAHNVIYYLTKDNEIKKIEADKLNLAQTHVEARKLPFAGAVTEIKLDARGNFFLIITEAEGGKNKLVVVEKDTLRVAAEVPEAGDKLDVDNVGNIYFLDQQKRLRLANTNFSTFEKGGLDAARQVKLETLRKLRERIAQGLTLPSGKPVPRAEETEEGLLGELGRKLQEQLGPRINEAKSLADVDELSGQIAALKGTEGFAAYPQVFSSVEEKLAGKESEIRSAQLRIDIEDYEQFIGAVATLSDVLEVEKKFALLQKLRRAVSIPDAKMRKEIDARIKGLDERRAHVLLEFSVRMEEEVAKLFGDIQTLIDEATTPDELQSINGDRRVIAFEEAMAYVKPEAKRLWKQAFRDKKKERADAIQKAIEEEEEQRRVKMAEIINDAAEILDEVGRAIEEQVTDSKELKKFVTRSPLVTKFRTKILALPENLMADQNRKFEALIREKERDLEHREVLNMPKSGGDVDFGSAKFPVYKDVERVWMPRVIPSAEDSKYGMLVFEDNQGRTFRPKVGSVPIDTHAPETAETIAVYRKDAAKYFESIKRVVPPYDEKWSMSEHVKGELSSMAQLLKQQQDNQKGIFILEGEAGTGKNVLVDMFAHFTNRETYTFSCNFQTEKEDITFAFKFDPGKGTYNVDSRLIEMLQTPGTVIVLDEINTLPPGVTKMLNPLLDYRRALYLPDGRIIKADPTVLIVGTMNPQHYLGVKPIAQEVKSRARIKFVEYPPEKRGAKYSPDEAMILHKYVDGLSGLKDDEFAKLWDYVVNGDTSGGGDKFMDKNKEREALCKRVQTVIKTANKIREAYKAFRTGQSADVVEFVFSMRETIDIAMEMNHTRDVKVAMKDVVLPKISDPAERQRIATIIDNV